MHSLAGNDVIVYRNAQTRSTPETTLQYRNAQTRSTQEGVPLCSYSRDNLVNEPVTDDRNYTEDVTGSSRSFGIQ